VAKKSAALKQANVSNTKQKTHQKPTKDKKITEQTTVSAPAKVEAPVNTPVTASQHPRSCDSVLTRSTFYSQAMHCSMSFRAIVLLGSVALLTAFYQSMQPSAFTIPTGLTQRQLVRPGTGFLWIRYSRPPFSGIPFEPATPSVARGGFRLRSPQCKPSCQQDQDGHRLDQRARRAPTVRCRRA